MPVSVGDKVPDVGLHVMSPEGAPQPVQSGEVLGKGKVVLFAVPGAFTPGCSKIHLPGYIQNGAQLKAKGVDTIACIAVNDAWVMDAWAKDQGADDIVMLADGSGFGLGKRSQRYAAVIEDGTITKLEVEAKPGVDVSSCDSILEKLG